MTEKKSDSKKSEDARLEALGVILRDVFGEPHEDPWASFKPRLAKRLLEIE